MDAQLSSAMFGVEVQEPLACKKDENDDEDEDDWGSRGRELRPTIAGIVCLKATDQSGQHCYNTPEHFLKTVCKLYVNRGFLLDGFPACFLTLP